MYPAANAGSLVYANASQQMASASVSDPAGAPGSLVAVVQALAETRSRLQHLNSELVSFRSNVMGEGEPPSAAEKAQPAAAGVMGAIETIFRDIGNNLEMAERQVSAIRRLG